MMERRGKKTKTFRERTDNAKTKVRLLHNDHTEHTILLDLSWHGEWQDGHYLRFRQEIEDDEHTIVPLAQNDLKQM